MTSSLGPEISIKR